MYHPEKVAQYLIVKADNTKAKSRAIIIFLLNHYSVKDNVVSHYHQKYSSTETYGKNKPRKKMDTLRLSVKVISWSSTCPSVKKERISNFNKKTCLFFPSRNKLESSLELENVRKLSRILKNVPRTTKRFLEMFLKWEKKEREIPISTRKLFFSSRNKLESSLEHTY